VTTNRCDAPRACRQLGPLIVAVVLVLLASGCTGSRSRSASDSAEAVLATTEDRARAALVKILKESGYSVTIRERGRLIRSEYRREIRSPWNGLIIYRFGTIRTWVEATVAPEADATRVKITVFCDGKDGLFASWRRYETPLPQQAATHLRQVKQILELL
jgi:hypothetical protein